MMVLSITIVTHNRHLFGSPVYPLCGDARNMVYYAMLILHHLSGQCITNNACLAVSFMYNHAIVVLHKHKV